MSERLRVAVLNSHPIQYFAPLYAYLNAQPDIEMTALYLSDFSLRGGHDPGFGRAVTWDVDLLSGYASVFVGARAKQRTPAGFWSLIAPEIWSTVRNGRYDALWLHGYNHAAYVIAWLAAKSKGIPVFMRSETHLALTRTSGRRRLRDGVLARAYRSVDALLAIGSANRAYYRALGAPDERIFDVPYSVDNARFMASAAAARPERDAERARLGLQPGVPTILYASKLQRRKHPDDVVRAVAALRADGVDAQVLLVGTGEMESELRELAQDLPAGSVVFGGFVNQAQMPRIFAAADVFVLPSENEPWGLIVNEAMCAGLPVVVGEDVGCVADLVRPGANGALCRAGDAASLAAALKPILVDAGVRERMGQASLEIIRHWDYAACLRGLRAALASVSRTPLARQA